MTSPVVLSITTYLYGFAAVVYLFSWVFKKTRAAQLAHWVGWVGAAANLLGIVIRWMESYKMGIGHAPLSNLYESLIFFSLVVTLIYLIIEKRYHSYSIGVFVSPLAILAIAYASLSPSINDQIRPLIPALKSNWLIAHVVTCFIGYAAFATAFALSIMYLLRSHQGEATVGIIAKFPPEPILDELTHRMVLFGFLFLSMGIITGAVWANSAWGRYWGWDPKETWSLITWFIYATLLHARLMRGWEGRRIAYLSISGFAAVLFTYFGVNLLPGLHSYGTL